MTGSVQIQTRVPEEWRDEADELEVTLAEYVRMMVRSGRRDWGFEHMEEPDQPHVKVEEETKTAGEQINAIVKDAIVRNLSTDDGTSEDELIEIILHDLEGQIGQILNELASEGVVRYDPVEGGWVKDQ